ncbi:MFS transporter [Corynebacterium ciconiae]|uniref:MFS transporter n=1 Tax=Corynebacterium ciconiae TaxID=227319 RepID=UPI00142F12EF|nr:MFS transporter [Corynebacterium ciconiae]
MVLLIVLVAVCLLPETAASAGAQEATVEQGRLFSHPLAFSTFIGSASVIGWAYGVNGMWQSVVPLSALGSEPSQLLVAGLASWMLGISALAQVLAFQLDVRRILVPSLVVLAFGLGASAWAVSRELAVVVWAATAVVGVGQGLSFRSSLAIAAESATAEKQATAISLYYVFGYVMTAAAPLVSTHASVSMVLAAMAACCVLSALAIALLWHRGRGVRGRL